MVQSVLVLVDRTSLEAEFDVAKTHVAKLNGDEKTKLTTARAATTAGAAGAMYRGPTTRRSVCL